MPMCALADSLWIGRIQRPFRAMHSGAFEGMKRRRGFAHRLLLALARVITTKVVLRSDGEGQQRVWESASLQKGLEGSCVLLPNGERDAFDVFPPPSLGDSFVAVFLRPEYRRLERSPVRYG